MQTAERAKPSLAMAIDWKDVSAGLDERGFAPIPGLLSAADCDAVAALYDDDARFRSRVVMAAHGFGSGEYKYFAYPLPEPVRGLRRSLYPPLARVANGWNEALGAPERFPPRLEAYLERCRAAGQQGKLALVLAVEVTKLFPSGDYLAQLDELRGMGVRSVQVVHHADNRFGGAAPIPELMSAADKIELINFGSDLTRINDIVCRNTAGSSGKCNGDSYLNVQGLSTEGTALIRAMMDRGMLVDVAVQPKQKVLAGERLAVIEAMKMENVLFATQDGVVDELLANKGESLAVDQPILRFA